MHPLVFAKEKLEWAQVREGGEQEREARDAQAEERHPQERQGPASEGEEPRASDRDRPLRGALQGREGAAQALLVQEVVRRPQDDAKEDVVAEEDLHAQEVVDAKEVLLAKEGVAVT